MPSKTPKARLEANARWRKKNPQKMIEYQRAYRERHPEKYKAMARKSSRRYLYGEITRPEPLRCEACSILFSETKKGSCIDHNHITGKFRGWLCSPCNLALGHLKDDAHRIIDLLHYVEQFVL